MKKLSGITAVSFCIILGCLNVSAQTAFNKSPRVSVAGYLGGASAGRSVETVVPNSKTIACFGRDYREASDASWIQLNDHMLLCRFTLNHIIHRAFYNTHGKLVYTEFGYPAELLDKSIYNWIKSVYYNDAIVFVNEIDRPGEPNIYVVEVSGNNRILKIRVEGDDMQVIKQILKY